MVSRISWIAHLRDHFHISSHSPSLLKKIFPPPTETHWILESARSMTNGQHFPLHPLFCTVYFDSTSSTNLVRDISLTAATTVAGQQQHKKTTTQKQQLNMVCGCTPVYLLVPCWGYHSPYYIQSFLLSGEPHAIETPIWLGINHQSS